MKIHGRTLKHMLLNERSQSEKSTYCKIPTIWHSGKGKNCGDNKKMSVFQGLKGQGGCLLLQHIYWKRRAGREEWIDGAQSETEHWNYSVWFPLWQKHINIHSYKPTEYTTPRLSPNVNYRHWMMCPCRFIDYNKYATPLWWGMLMVGDIMHAWGQRYI